MAEVRYVCLSDLHLGEEDSVLSNMNQDGTEGDCSEPSPVLKQLALCIKDLGNKFCRKNKPILVLNGDAMELALSPIHQTSMAFQCFIKQFTEGEDFLFEKILFLPGNHDHHLWVMTREDQYRGYLERHEQDPEVVKLPEQWHSTKLFTRPKDTPVISRYLSDLIQRPPVNLKNVQVEVAYPNLGIVVEPDLMPKQMPEKCVVFHHGQFTEWIYTAMSTANDWIFAPPNTARHVWELEKENFAWIDFAWSALGQSWDSGKGLETVYEKALDDAQFGEIIANLSAGLAKEIGTRTFDWVEGAIIDKVLSMLYRSFAGTEKGQSNAPLTPSGLKELYRYVEGPLHAQICYDILAWQKQKHELDETKYTAEYFKDEIAPSMTFVFGHTHKPFGRSEPFHGYRGEVDVYNTGGWVVDSLQYNEWHGGSLILVDDQLNVAAIRMYNETRDNSPIPVRLEPISNSSHLPNPLATEIEKLKFDKAGPWKKFSQEVASAIPMRRKYLGKRVFSSLSRTR